MRKTAVMSVLLLGTALALVPASAEAAKGGGGATTGGASSVRIDQPGPYSIGDVVTFTGSTTSTTKPWEQVMCYQGGVRVLFESHPDYVPNSLNDTGEFALGPTSVWQSGGADCVATLAMNTKRGMQTLASLSFSVAG
jgi:hypothetical protein